MKQKRTYVWTKGSVLPHERILNRLKAAYDGELPSDGCWVWPGSRYSDGYGSIRTGSRADGTRRLRSTHVVMYEHFVGPVPEGLELDHLCRVRACCRPEHLEAVTHPENSRRMPDDYKDELRKRLALARSVRWTNVMRGAL